MTKRLWIRSLVSATRSPSVIVCVTSVLRLPFKDIKWKHKTIGHSEIQLWQMINDLFTLLDILHILTKTPVSTYLLGQTMCVWNLLLVWRSRPSVCSLSRSALSLVSVCEEVYVPFNVCKPLVYQAHNICKYTSSGSMWHHSSSRCSLKLCVEQNEPAPCTSSIGSFVANAEPPLSLHWANEATT